VNLFVWAGYFFGNLPLIKNNFGLVTIGIIIVSMLPMAVMMIRQART
jgi:membrane-associated protein